jgi:outer membrane protein OmpA-like peptidoglycan-associated protein
MEMVQTYLSIAARTACALALGCLAWGATGTPAGAQVSADQIINALAPAPTTRGLTGVDAKPMNESDRAFVKTLRHRTRSLTFEESERVADLSKDWKKIDLEIYFEYNSARLAAEAGPQLNQLGDALRSPRLKNAAIIIAGHTDAKGSQSYNERLSDRRADAVKRYLVERLNVPAENLATAGYGKRHLKNPDDPYGPENRRVQILNPPGSESASQ